MNKIVYDTVIRKIINNVMKKGLRAYIIGSSATYLISRFFDIKNPDKSEKPFLVKTKLQPSDETDVLQIEGPVSSDDNSLNMIVKNDDIQIIMKLFQSFGRLYSCDRQKYNFFELFKNVISVLHLDLDFTCNIQDNPQANLYISILRKILGKIVLEVNLIVVQNLDSQIIYSKTSLLCHSDFLKVCSIGQTIECDDKSLESVVVSTYFTADHQTNHKLLRVKGSKPGKIAKNLRKIYPGKDEKFYKLVSSSLEEDNCSICLDTLNQPHSLVDKEKLVYVTECGHIYHSNCLKKMLYLYYLGVYIAAINNLNMPCLIENDKMVQCNHLSKCPNCKKDIFGINVPRKSKPAKLFDRNFSLSEECFRKIILVS